MDKRDKGRGPKGTGKPDPSKDRSAHETSRGVRVPTLADLSRGQPTEDELLVFITLVDAEPSDRSAALMSASLVEHALHLAVNSRLADCGEAIRNTWFNDATAPFGSFAAKIKLGRALGIYKERMDARLLGVKDIRNVFAHRASPIDFTHPTLDAACRKLIAPRQFDEGGARSAYCGTCMALAKLLVADAFEYGGREMTVSFP